MSKAISSGTRGVRVSGEMTIFSAAALKQPLLEALGKSKARAGRKAKSPQGGFALLGMDLSQVSEFDTAGLQLVLLARQAAANAGRTLVVTAASHIVRESFTLCGALGLLADAPAGEVVL